MPPDMLEQVRPMQFNKGEIENLSDKQLIDILSGKTHKKGEVTPKLTSLIQSELIRRNTEKLSKPHAPSFWILVVATFLSAIAAVSSVIALPQVQKLLFSTEEPQKQEYPVEKHQQLNIQPEPQKESSKPSKQKKSSD